MPVIHSGVVGDPPVQVLEQLVLYARAQDWCQGREEVFQGRDARQRRRVRVLHQLARQEARRKEHGPHAVKLQDGAMLYPKRLQQDHHDHNVDRMHAQSLHKRSY